MDIISETLFSNGDKSAKLYTLQNKNGLKAQFTNYGASWVSMYSPDKWGIMDDVVLGFDTINGYLNAGERYHGAVVGRVCGRINNAQFKLDEQMFNLASNDVYGKPHPNHLHGGINAFHNRIWQAEKKKNIQGEEFVIFSCTSPDGEEGYPGEVSIQVTYTLTNEDTVRIEYKATTDKKTIVNLTNHTFFNLCGSKKHQNILSQFLKIDGSTIVECDEELIPTGRLISVAGTNLDFGNFRTLAESLTKEHSQIQKDIGFSIAFALDNKKQEELHLAAQLKNDETGRLLSVYTDQPSIQVYTAYFMDGTDIGKYGIPYHASAGVALETQGFPDAVNHPDFPSITLDKGEEYRHITEYKFETIS